jgi:hypothetical protein
MRRKTGLWVVAARKCSIKFVSVSMRPWVSSPEKKRNLDSKCDLDALDTVEQEHSQFLIKNVQLYDGFKVSPGSEIIGDCRLAASGRHTRYAEGIPIPTQTVVADSL